MGVFDRIVQMTERIRGEDVFPYLSYDPSTKTYFIEGAPENRNYLGVVWFGIPLVGANDATAERLRSILADNYPEGTVIQFYQISTPDTEQVINQYLDRRPLVYPENFASNQAQFFSEYRRRRAMFLLSTKNEPPPGQRKPSHVTTLLVTMKIPITFFPKEEDIGQCESYMIKFEEALNSLWLRLRLRSFLA